MTLVELRSAEIISTVKVPISLRTFCLLCPLLGGVLFAGVEEVVCCVVFELSAGGEAGAVNVAIALSSSLSVELTEA